jgi:hypothetical protein
MAVTVQMNSQVAGMQGMQLPTTVQSRSCSAKINISEKESQKRPKCNHTTANKFMLNILVPSYEEILLSPDVVTTMHGPTNMALDASLETHDSIHQRRMIWKPHLGGVLFSHAYDSSTSDQRNTRSVAELYDPHRKPQRTDFRQRSSSRSGSKERVLMLQYYFIE